MTKETKQTALEQFAIALYEKGLLIGNGDWMQDVLQEFKKIDIQQKIEISKNSYIAGYLDNQSKIDDSMNFPDDYINEICGEAKDELIKILEKVPSEVESIENNYGSSEV